MNGQEGFNKPYKQGEGLESVIILGGSNRRPTVAIVLTTRG